MRLAALFFLLLVPLTTQRVYAQSQGDVTLTAQLGFDGSCKLNTWIPIRVKVENKGADFNARVQVSYQNDKGGQSAHAIDLSLPTNSRKEMFLYLYPDGYLGKLSVDVLSGDKVLATTPLNIKCIAGENTLIGAISSDSTPQFASTREAPFTGFVRVAQLQLADLPDQSQGWEGLDALVISGADTGSITDPQRAALKDWLAQGGKLLIAGGPKWQGTVSGLGELLPIALSGTRTLNSLSALQSYTQSTAPLDDSVSAVVATGQLRPNAVVLLQQDGVPLIVEKPLGAGTIYFFAADPALQPLDKWTGMSVLYGALLGNQSARPPWTNAAWDTSTANRALAALPALGLPPTLYVLCLLGIYILVIGPINYFLLRRIKRQEWAWISIPAFVILFTLVAYFSGFLIRGPRPILNRLTIAQAWDGVEQAQTRSLVGVYAPVRTKYTLQTGNSSLAYPFDSNTQTLQANQGWLSVQQGQDVLLPDVLVESGGMKAAFLSGKLPALAITHNLVLSLNAGFPTISGTITNNSKYTLRDVVLLTSDDRRKLGDFPPGAKKTVQLYWMSDPKGAYISDAQANGGYPYYSYSGGKVDDRLMRQETLLQSLQTSGQRSAKVTSGIYLTGWLDDPLLSTTVQGQNPENYDTTFYTLKLSPKIQQDAGPIKLTPGLFQWESSTPDLSPFMDSYYGMNMPGGGYALNFTLAVPVHYRTVKSLVLNLQGNNTSGSSRVAIRVSLKDWTTGQWVLVKDLNWGSISIADPSNYVGPGGKISLKLDSGNVSNYEQITASYFTMVVEP